MSNRKKSKDCYWCYWCRTGHSNFLGNLVDFLLSQLLYRSGPMISWNPSRSHCTSWSQAWLVNVSQSAGSLLTMMQNPGNKSKFLKACFSSIFNNRVVTIERNTRLREIQDCLLHNPKSDSLHKEGNKIFMDQNQCNNITRISRETVVLYELYLFGIESVCE